MKIGIISDIHDNAHNLVMALDQITNTEGVEKIIFLGDFCGAGISVILRGSPIPVYAIWGNNDGDKCLITKFSNEENSNLKLGFDTFDTIEIDGRKIFISHYPMLAKPMCKSGDFDAVFYGHDHQLNKDRINDCLLVNPGEVGAYKTGKATFAIYDSNTNDAEIVEIRDAITANTEVSKKKFEELKFTFSKQKSHKL